MVTPVQLAAMHANADCERLLRDRERDVVQLAAALRGAGPLLRCCIFAFVYVIWLLTCLGWRVHFADGKRVVALLGAHPLLIRYSDTTGKNILHVR